MDTDARQLASAIAWPLAQRIEGVGAGDTVGFQPRIGLEAGERLRDGLMDQWTVEAMQIYHRRHMVVSWQLDRETARVLMTDAREPELPRNVALGEAVPPLAHVVRLDVVVLDAVDGERLYGAVTLTDIARYLHE